MLWNFSHSDLVYFISTISFCCDGYLPISRGLIRSRLHFFFSPKTLLHHMNNPYVWFSFFVILWLIGWSRYYEPNPFIIKFPIIYFPNSFSSQHNCIHQCRLSFIAVTKTPKSQWLTTKDYSHCVTSEAWP